MVPGPGVRLRYTLELIVGPCGIKWVIKEYVPGYQIAMGFIRAFWHFVQPPNKRHVFLGPI